MKKDQQVISEIVATLAPKTQTPYKGVYDGKHVVQVSREEYGKIVGKNGLTIASLNALASYMHANGGAAGQVILLPPQDDGPIVRVPYIPGASYNRDKVSRILSDILDACSITGKVIAGQKSVAVVLEKSAIASPLFEKAFVAIGKALTRFTGYPADVTVLHEEFQRTH